jgi:hypothetical protein
LICFAALAAGQMETHVYLSSDDFVKLKQIADAESRSTTMQIEYFLRQAIGKYSVSSGKG